MEGSQGYAVYCTSLEPWATRRDGTDPVVGLYSTSKIWYRGIPPCILRYPWLFVASNSRRVLEQGTPAPHGTSYAEIGFLYASAMSLDLEDLTIAWLWSRPFFPLSPIKHKSYDQSRHRWLHPWLYALSRPTFVLKLDKRAVRVAVKIGGQMAFSSLRLIIRFLTIRIITW
jgi:hypothetical protein